MARTFFKYNQKTLKVEEVRVSFADFFRKFLWYIAVGIVFGGGFVILGYYFIETPREKQQKRELARFELQYEIINKKMEQITQVLSDIEQRDDYVYRMLFETDPISSSIRKAGVGGSEPYSYLENYDYSNLFISTQKKIDKLSNRLYIQSKSLDEILILAENKDEMMKCIPAIQPVSKNSSYIASGFGMRLHPIYNRKKMHQGIDFSAPRNTEIYATGNGKVIKSGRNSGYGNTVLIDHGFGYKSLYAHMEKTNVRKGQKVKRGDIIGYVGSTGLSVAPHVHYEIIKNGKKINPVNFFYNDLTPEEYEKVIEEASTINKALS